jgi:hypothetical protein
MKLVMVGGGEAGGTNIILKLQATSDKEVWPIMNREMVF